MNKELIKENLANAFADFKKAIGKHSDINKKRADGGWSIGEISSHIIKSTRVNLGKAIKADRSFDQHAAAIKELFLNFQMKFPTAPPLQPETKNYSVTELFSALDINLESVLGMIDNNDFTDICVEIQIPVWGTLTKYEWLVLFESHIMRHTKQINDFDKVTTQPKIKNYAN